MSPTSPAPKEASLPRLQGTRVSAPWSLCPRISPGCRPAARPDVPVSFFTRKTPRPQHQPARISAVLRPRPAQPVAAPAAGPGCLPAPPGPPARQRQPEQCQASWPRLELYELALYKLSITRAISLKNNIIRRYEHFHIVSITTSNGLAAPERNGHLSLFLLAAEALHPSSCVAHILP